MNKVLFSSQKEEWGTPQEFFDKLNNEFNFTVDVCALPYNAKCARYYTPETDGLAQNWDNETVWCNPPYGRKIASWVEKAAHAKATVVMLVPARTDTKWFHDYVYKKAECRFVKGRLKFESENMGGDPAPFPSMVVIFRNKEIV